MNPTQVPLTSNNLSLNIRNLPLKFFGYFLIDSDFLTDKVKRIAEEILESLNKGLKLFPSTGQKTDVYHFITKREDKCYPLNGVSKHILDLQAASKDPDWAVRSDTLKLFSYFPNQGCGFPEAFELGSEALQVLSEDVRSSAVDLFSELARTRYSLDEVVSFADRALQDTSSKVRISVAVLIYQILSSSLRFATPTSITKKAILLACKAIDDPEQEVRSWALQALNSFFTDSCFSSVKFQDLDKRQRLLEECALAAYKSMKDPAIEVAELGVLLLSNLLKAGYDHKKAAYYLLVNPISFFPGSVKAAAFHLELFQNIIRHWLAGA